MFRISLYGNSESIGIVSSCWVSEDRATNGVLYVCS